MDIDQGGPAYPTMRPPDEDGLGGYVYHGMTLRDWFAGQALAGLLTDHAASSQAPVIIATIAYGFADAMVEISRHTRDGF